MIQDVTDNQQIPKQKRNVFVLLCSVWIILKKLLIDTWFKWSQGDLFHCHLGNRISTAVTMCLANVSGLHRYQTNNELFVALINSYTHPFPQVISTNQYPHFNGGLAKPHCMWTWIDNSHSDTIICLEITTYHYPKSFKLRLPTICIRALSYSYCSTWTRQSYISTVLLKLAW